MKEMNRWPVYKALYKTIYFSGVPLPLLVLEVFAAIVCVLLGAFLAIIPIILIHFGVRIALQRDPYILSILMDLLSLKNGNAEKDKGGESHD